MTTIPSLLRRTLATSLAVAALACGDEDVGAGGRTAAARPAPTHVDSIIPIEEALRRFREELPAVSALAGGAVTRDSLVQRFVRAVEHSDTSALQDLVLSRAEFAYLYYPSTKYTSKPYEMDPALLWFLTQENSEKGITRVVWRLGGRPLGFDGYSCPPEPRREGENQLWEDCTVRFRDVAGDTVTRRLFGTVIERGGRYKFISYSNDF